MNQLNSTAAGTPKDPVTHPEVPDSQNPTEPEGLPDPPPTPDPYPVIDPPLEPDTEPAPVEDPVPPFPEPIPGTVTDANLNVDPR